MSNDRVLAMNDLIAEALADPDDREEILFSRWYRGLLDEALKARLRDRLTQTEIAHSMKTQQPSITKIERDDDGGISVRRLWSYLRACGLVPTADLLKEDVVFARLKDDPMSALTALSSAQSQSYELPIIQVNKDWMPLSERVAIGSSRTRQEKMGFPTPQNRTDWSTSSDGGGSIDSPLSLEKSVAA